MSKFVLLDPATTYSFDTEEEAIAYVKKIALGDSNVPANLGVAANPVQNEMLVCEATIVRKLSASIATSPGSDKMWRDIEADRKAEIEKLKAQGYYAGTGGQLLGAVGAGPIEDAMNYQTAKSAGYRNY